MYAAKGVGLAAPQIGISRRIAVIDSAAGEGPPRRLVLINPEIIRNEGQTGDRRRLPQRAGFPRAGAARLQGHRAGAERQGRDVRGHGRGSSGARLRARDRSPERQALPQPAQRPEAGRHPAAGAQAPEGRRVGVRKAKGKGLK